MKQSLLFISIFVLLFSALSHGQTLFVNEFLASNDFGLTDPFGDNDDWIEIYNAGSEAVDIGGMYVTDDLLEPTMWQIPATYPDSTTIQPGGFLILWADKESEEGVLHLELKLSGSGEQIGLVQVVDTDTSFIDSLTYGEQTADTSYARFPDGSSTWKIFNQPTPGASNGKVNLLINEFLASNDFGLTDPFGDNDDWIEIFNPNDFAVDIGGLFVTDDLAERTLCQIPRTAPDTTTIPAGGFLLLWADKESEEGVLHLELKLSGGGEQVGLVQIINTDTTFLDSLTYDEQTADTSFGRIEDGGDNWGFFSITTPGASNSGGTLVGINEAVNPAISGYHLYQNYPNPFNPATTISFNLPVSEKVAITVFSINGQKIATLLDEKVDAGVIEVKWNARNFSSGVYFYTIKSSSFFQTKKMILLK